MKNTSLEKVSILIAAYNVEKYIGKCIQSVIDQTYENLEIIVVDDCSTDNTKNICDDYAKQDSRIICIHHEVNKKLPGARNTGLDHATGNYIVFVDGDDWLAPDFVEYLYKIIVDTDSDMAISCTNFTTRDYKQTEKDSIEIWSPEKATENFLYSKIPIGAWDKIYKRSFIEDHKLRFKPLFTAEGYRFISDCSQRANQVAVGHRRIYYYRLNNPKSATTLPDIRQGLGASEALDGIEKDLILKTPEIMTSLHHHRWLNKLYTLRIILVNKSQKEHKDIYNDCLQYIHKNGIKLAGELGFNKRSLKIILTSTFPVLLCRYVTWKKNRELLKDIKNEANF